MLNQAVIVGRLVQDLEIKELENGNKETEIILSCQRAYKNEEGMYETDFIPVRLFGKVAQNTLEYCHKGDIIGVRGRVQIEDEKIVIMGERITFLSNNKDILEENK